MKLYILWVLGDIPAITSLWNTAGPKAYSGCPYCTIHGDHCARASSVIYTQGRQRLPMDHPARRSDDYDFQEETPPFPEKSLQKTVDEHVFQWENLVLEAASAEALKQFTQQSGYKGYYSMLCMEMHASKNGIPDIMHLMSCWWAVIMKLLDPSDKVRGARRR